jgi:NAD(P)H-dependent flavin oxidoreductase YrpB (nitropropane dioxygenase family)
MHKESERVDDEVHKAFGLDHPIVQGGMQWVARAERPAIR